MAEKLSPIQTELLSRADAIFSSISSTIGKATDFAAAQIPDIALQFVAFGRAYTSIAILVSLTIFVVGLYLVVRVAIQDSYKTDTKHSYGWSDSRTGAIICGSAMSMVGFAGLAANIHSFLMVWFAPKIWLITEIVKLAK